MGRLSSAAQQITCLALAGIMGLVASGAALNSCTALLTKIPCFQGLLPASPAIGSSGTPLPALHHRQLNRSEICKAPGSRLIIVGDVHGCITELQKLLETTNFQAGRDTIILVGDLVNKGPGSLEVIRLARNLGALCVRGNHDDELLEAWYKSGRYKQGLPNGYPHDAVFKVSQGDIRWLQELPLSLSFPWLQMRVVHAGLVPGVPLHQQKFKDLLWMRDLQQGEDGTWIGLQRPRTGSQPWAAVWKGPEHIVFGHDAKRQLQQERFATGLDTGCCYGKKLTALVVDCEDFEQRTIMQVPAARMYEVPEDHGKK